MRTSFVIPLLVLGVVTSAANATNSHQHLKGANLLPQASLSFEDAAKKALEARPGSITDRELEKERGGSGLRYSFDVVSAGRKYEVGIDAKTGRVLENAIEGAHAD